MASSNHSDNSPDLASMRPEDVGLSPLDYHKQARDGHDPLFEHGEVGRSILRQLLGGECMTADEIANGSEFFVGTVRRQCNDLVTDGVLGAGMVDDDNYPRLAYSLTREFREPDLYDAARLYRRVHSDD